MHSSSFPSIILGCVALSSIALAQTTDASTSSIAIDCNLNDYASLCIIGASVPTDTASDISTPTTTFSTSTTETPYMPSIVNSANFTATRTSNLSSMSTTLISGVLSTTSSIPSYLNTSIVTFNTSISIPTSILIATGTPTPESGGAVGGLTVTRFTYVMPSATDAGSSKASTTTTQGSSASMERRTGLSGLLCFVLGVWGLFLM